MLYLCKVMGLATTEGEEQFLDQNFIKKNPWLFKQLDSEWCCQKCADEVNAGKLENDDALKKLEDFAKTNQKIKQHKRFLNTQVLGLKLYEAFLEGGPQSILQFTILMKSGIIDYFQIFTLATSLLSFSRTATSLYLGFSTKVL